MTKIEPGRTFLHTHPKKELSYEDWDEKHVIVDRDDWEIAVIVLSNPMAVNTLEHELRKRKRL